MRRKFSDTEAKTIKNIVKRVGVRGGFHSLSFEYLYDGETPCHSGIQGKEFKKSADELLEYFESLELPIKIEFKL